MIPTRRAFFLALLLAVAAAPAGAQQPIAIADIQRAAPVSFEDEILPILRKNCLACHSASEAYGDLVLETPAAMIQGGDSGPAIVPGDGANSLLLKVASHAVEPVMPPADNDVAAANLTPQQLGLFKLWIDQGARSTGVAGLLSPGKWRSLPPGTHPIYAVAVTPDGQFAACGRANQIFIYHVPTGRLVTRLTDPALQSGGEDSRPGVAHLDVVQSLAFNEQGDRLASGGFRTAKIWRSPRDVRRFPLAADDTVTAVAVSPDHRWIATGGADHSIRLWQADDGVAGPVCAGHTAAVTALCFSHDGARLYSASLDHSILAWSTADGSLAGRIATPEPVRALATVRRPAAAMEAAAPEAAPAAEPAESEVSAAFVGEELLVSGGGNFLHLWTTPDSLPQPLPEALPGARVLAVCREGRLLALADAQGQVQVRDHRTGEIIHTWSTGSGGIVSLAFAPPPVVAPPDEEKAGAEEADAGDATPTPSDQPLGLRLATAGDDGRVRVWTIATGDLEATLSGSLTPIRALAWRPDGAALAAGAESGHITEWRLDLPTMAPLRGAGDPATVAAVSRDGKRLATAELSAGQPAIVVRELESGAVIATLLGHEAPVLALAWDADGQRIVSGGEDHTTRVWDLRDAKFPQVARFAGHEAPVGAVAFNGDATQVLCGAANGALKLWSVADEAETRNFAGHTGAIHGVALLGGAQPVSASADKTLRFWNAADGAATRTLTEQVPLTALAVSSEAAQVAVAAGAEIKVYQAASGQLHVILAGLSAPATSLAFSGDNSRLAALHASEAAVFRVADGRLLEVVSREQPLTAGAIAHAGDALYLCDATGGIERRPLQFGQALEGSAQPITGLIYRRAAEVLFASAADGAVRGYNTSNGQALFAANHGEAVYDLALSPDEQTLASAGESKVKLWSAANGAAAQPPELTGVVGPFVSVRFAADGDKLVAVSAGESPRATAFTRADGLPEQVLPGGETVGRMAVVALASGEQRVVGLSADGSATAWRLWGQRRVAGHTGPVASLASLGAMQVVSGSADGTVRQWDLAASNPQLRQMNHGGPVSGVAAHGGVERIASVSENHTVRLWNAANGQQLAEMRGDLRAKEQVAKLQLTKADWTAKVAAAKTTVEAALKEIPLQTEAEKQLATALAAAEKVVVDRRADVDKAATAKIAAEKVAIEAAAAAQAAALKMRLATEQANQLAAEVQRLSERAARVQSLAQANPQNESFAKLAQETAAELSALQQRAQAAEAEKVQPTQASQAAAKVADDAAQQVIQLTKPYSDAATALAAADDALRIARQAHEVAQRDLQQALAAAPRSQEQAARSEAALAAVETELAAAVAAEQAAQQPLRAVAFAPDGLTLATGGDLGVVHTWSADAGKEVSSYVGHAGPIHAVAYATADTIVSGAADRQAIAWDANPAWQLERTIGAIDDPTALIDRVVAVAFSRDGRLLATGGGVPSRSGEVKIWQVADGALRHALPEAHTDGVNAVAFSADDAFLASAGADKLVKKWSVASGELLLQFEGHTEHVLGVDWRANGQLLASAGGDGVVRIWNAESGERVRVIAGYTKQVTDLRFVGQSPLVISVSGDPLVRLHNSDNGGVQRNFAGSADYMYTVDVTPDGAIVVAGGHDGVLRIWNGANAQVLHALSAPVEPAGVVADQPPP